MFKHAKSSKDNKEKSDDIELQCLSKSFFAATINTQDIISNQKPSYINQLQRLHQAEEISINTNFMIGVNINQDESQLNIRQNSEGMEQKLESDNININVEKQRTNNNRSIPFICTSTSDQIRDCEDDILDENIQFSLPIMKERTQNLKYKDENKDLFVAAKLQQYDQSTTLSLNNQEKVIQKNDNIIREGLNKYSMGIKSQNHSDNSLPTEKQYHQEEMQYQGHVCQSSGNVVRRFSVLVSNQSLQQQHTSLITQNQQSTLKNKREVFKMQFLSKHKPLVKKAGNSSMVGSFSASAYSNMSDSSYQIKDKESPKIDQKVDQFQQEKGNLQDQFN